MTPPNRAESLDTTDVDVIRKLNALDYPASEQPECAKERFLKRHAAPVGTTDSEWKRLDEAAGSTFGEVFQYELEALAGNADAAPGPAVLADVNRRAHAANLRGLALSGGGIRSATFNLGVIQALAEKRLLREFHYMSTVSGGGYIGGWLSKLIAAEGGDVERVEVALAPAGLASKGEKLPRVEHSAVQFLRQYANYMAPKTGLMSADTWTLVVTYLRNTLLNLTMLTAWLACLFLLPRLVAWFGGDLLSYNKAALYVCAIAAMAVAVFCIAHSISRKGRHLGKGWFSQSQGWVLAAVCLPLSLAAWAGSLALYQHRAFLGQFWRGLPASLWDWQARWLLVPGLLYIGVWAAGWIMAKLCNWRDAVRPEKSPPFPFWVPAALKIEWDEWCKGAKQSEQLRAIPGHEEKMIARVAKLKRPTQEALGHFLYAVGALAIGTVAILALVAQLHRSPTQDVKINVVALATFGMPLMLAVFGLVMTLMIGLIGRMYSDQSREWWARMGAWVSIIAVSWMLLFCCTFYLPPLLSFAFDRHKEVAATVTAFTSAVTFLGLRAGNSAQSGKPDSGRSAERFIVIAPLSFSLLFVAGVTAMLHGLIVDTGGTRPVDLRGYFSAYTSTLPAVTPNTAYSTEPAKNILMLIGLFLFAAVALGGRIDINKFSLYMMYRLRLVRAYFGASSTQRAPHPFTGFDPNDDPDLWSLLRRSNGDTGTPGAVPPSPAGRPLPSADLGKETDLGVHLHDELAAPVPAGGPDQTSLARQEQRAALSTVTATDGTTSDQPAAPTKLQRPYHIINAALNLVNGKNLAWQNRKAANFVFTPRFCGFETPALTDHPDGQAGPRRGAFRPTDRYARSTTLHEDLEGIKLGTAVAISGAAASPNMGYHSSPPLAFLMTLFNLRLGRWCPNPTMEHAWKRASPRIALFSILSELFGLTDMDANFVYLSDGGHFENLGIYELVRRRCRVILVIDASADNDRNFDDLGNAIRKCRTDLNVSIDLNVREIRQLSDANSTAVSFVSGTISYAEADGCAENGVLLYIKPNVVGAENADVFNYSRTHPDFPHQSTIDQFFDEDQFESYRSLGYHAAHCALKNVVTLGDLQLP